ncbi:hypothetical protein I302_102438 [Kwoniella bestiolae CBS 10118]|uniref:NTF2 domain-containing protein n=1 Tax=Kwoniella bestiolae CBS 10118 TaxID=1296100 RepID=A0A1B9GF06_9TREE|nr:hypothetical protein I302_01129 [Kwoniella bestiolae CBS 10118]OCF29620.1 hypothetical protein I302_01129 [Kwoniella bestiolae CBS 10118]
MATSAIPPQAQSMSIPINTVPQPWPPAAIDAASHGAIAFCQVYYEAYDEPTRRDSEIPLLYLPNSKIIWNGNTVPSDRPGLSEFLKGIPLSRHDLQTLDCHPVSAEPNTPPSLIINVTGSVLHGPTVLAPPSSAPDNRNNTANGKDATRDMPRKFHEMFMLKAVEQSEGMQPKYAIHSSNFRFIG